MNPFNNEQAGNQFFNHLTLLLATIAMLIIVVYDAIWHPGSQIPDIVTGILGTIIGYAVNSQGNKQTTSQTQQLVSQIADISRSQRSESSAQASQLISQVTDIPKKDSGA